MSKKQLALKAGVSVGTITNAEKSKNLFLDNLASIASALQMPPQSLGLESPTANTDDSFRGKIFVLLAFGGDMDALPPKTEIDGLINGVGNLLRAKFPIVPISVARGSILITVTMDIADISSLCCAYLSGALQTTGLEYVKILDGDALLKLLDASLPIVVSDTSPEEEAVQKEQIDAIEKAIQSLDQDAALALWATYSGQKLPNPPSKRRSKTSTE